MPLSPKTLDFLVENKLRDSRVWFQEHKKDYQEFVLQPMIELVENITPAMQKIDPLLITAPKVDKTISRIYRDTRFSKDKSLYREVMWCAFCRDKKAFPNPPGFVLEFSPDGFRYGCGYYQAPAKVMEAARKLILLNDASFQKARKAMEKQTIFTMEGELYKRSKCPDQPAALRNWLDRKNLDFLHNSKDFSLLFSDRLADTLAEGFQLLQPFYDFLRKAQDLA